MASLGDIEKTVKDTASNAVAAAKDYAGKAKNVVGNLTGVREVHKIQRYIHKAVRYHDDGE